MRPPRCRSGAGESAATEAGPRAEQVAEPLPRPIKDQYDKVKAGQGTPRISPDTGLQQTYRGSGAGLRQQGHWKDALEWDVPGTTYRIPEQVDENGVPTGVLGYVLELDYNAPFYFPAPWYPEGGVVPRRLGGPGR